MNQPPPSRTAPASAASDLRRLSRLALWQAAVTALFMLLLVRAVDLGELRDALAPADTRWLLPALLLFTSAKFIDSWRWRFLLRGLRNHAPPLPQRGLFAAFLLGNAVNNLLPLRLGDVAKIQFLANRYGAPRAAVAASVFVVEATLDGVVFVLFLLAALWWWDLGAIGTLTAAAVTSLVAIALIAFALALLLGRGAASDGPVARLGIRLSSLLPARARDPWASQWDRLVAGLHALQRWSRTLGAIALSIPAWLVEAGMFALYGRAFGLELSYPTFLAVMIAANLAVALPIALWNFGPYETLVAAVLVAADVDRATAVSYALTAHLLTNLWIVASGLAVVWIMRIRPRDLLRLHDHRAAP